MEKYAYLIAAVVLAIVSGMASYLYQTRRAKDAQQRSWIDYLLLWPLILDANKNEREGKFFTKRECFGWAAVALIIICAIIFTGRR